MSIVELVAKKMEGIPPEGQREVLDFIEFLRQKFLKELASSGPRRSLAGLWEKYGIDVSGEDIEQARSELWGNFPREDIR